MINIDQSFCSIKLRIVNNKHDCPSLTTRHRCVVLLPGFRRAIRLSRRFCFLYADEYNNIIFFNWIAVYETESGPPVGRHSPKGKRRRVYTLTVVIITVCFLLFHIIILLCLIVFVLHRTSLASHTLWLSNCVCIDPLISIKDIIIIIIIIIHNSVVIDYYNWLMRCTKIFHSKALDTSKDKSCVFTRYIYFFTF